MKTNNNKKKLFFYKCKYFRYFNLFTEKNGW